MEKVVGNKTYQYEIYKLVDKFPDALYTVTPEFDFNNPPTDPQYLTVSLLQTMVKHYGIGLAAPQVGLSYRVFVIGSENGEGFACFNPKILKQEGSTSFAEGCLTFSGLYLNIVRPETIEVEFQNMYGKTDVVKFSGLTARTFLHELDHLNGVVYTKLVSPYVLDKAKAKVKSNLKKLERQRVEQEKARIIAQAARNVAEEKRIEELNKQLVMSIPNINIEIPEIRVEV